MAPQLCTAIGQETDIFGYVFGCRTGTQGKYPFAKWIQMDIFMAMLNIQSLAISAEILSLISSIDEFKGA